MDNIVDKISFSKIKEKDLPLIHQWLCQDFVNQWWGNGIPTFEETKKKYLAYILNEKPTIGFIINYVETPIGYIQTYQLNDYPEYQEAINYKENAISIDLFIGDKNFIHKGLGSLIIKNFLQEIAFKTFNLSLCIIGPDPKNKVAIRAYEKAGFKHLRTVKNQEDGKEEYLMQLFKQDLN